MKNIEANDLEKTFTEIEEGIKNVASAFEAIGKSKLKMDTIILLIQANTKPKMSKEDIENVIQAAVNLKSAHLKK